MALSLLVLLLVSLALLVSGLSSLMRAPDELVGALGDRFKGAATQTSRSLGEAGQSLRGALDPARPPGDLVYDRELLSLELLRVGHELQGGEAHVLTVQEIRRKDGAPSPETLLYAVIAAELRQPREVRLLGQLLRTERDRREHILYKGELFRLGPALYRVNWISQEQGVVAIARHRHPDTVTDSPKFSYE